MDVRQEQDGGEVEEDSQRGVGQQSDQHIRPAVGGAEIVQEGDLVDVVAHLTGEEDGQSPHKRGQLEGIAEGDQLGKGEGGGRDSGKYRITTVAGCDIVDQFLDEHGFSNAGTTKQTNLTTLDIRGKKINYLNSGF